MTTVSIEPKWMVVANVKRETEHGTGGSEKELGLKHFSPGTKVYLYLRHDDRVEVFGRHRGGSRLVKLVVQLRHLENFRVKLAYDPRVLWLSGTEEEAKNMLGAALAWTRVDAASEVAP